MRHLKNISPFLFGQRTPLRSTKMSQICACQRKIVLNTTSCGKGTFPNKMFQMEAERGWGWGFTFDQFQKFWARREWRKKADGWCRRMLGHFFWTQISSGFQKSHRIFQILSRSFSMGHFLSYGDFLKKVRIRKDSAPFSRFWHFWLRISGQIHTRGCYFEAGKQFGMVKWLSGRRNVKFSSFSSIFSQNLSKKLPTISRWRHFAGKWKGLEKNDPAHVQKG